MTENSNKLTFAGVDWPVIFIYLALVLIGWLNIYAAVYDEAHANIFDISQRYGMQLVWMGISFFLAVSVLLIDAKYYHILAYPLYWITIVILLGVFVFGKEVNGARSWYEFGPVRIQPTEFVKFTASLAVARAMSSYNFNIHRFSSVATVFFILAIPVGIIMLQNDTGSALVYGAFFFMLFREGFNGWLYVALFMLVTLFVFSFWLEPVPLLLLMLLVCIAGEGALNEIGRAHV